MRQTLGFTLISVLLVLTACSSQPSRDTDKTEFTIDELRQRAQFASEAGAHADALLNYNRILAKDAENIESLIGSGEIMLAINKASRAEGYFSRVLELEPSNTRAREGRALAWLMMGNYADARKSFLNLTDDGVERWQVWNGLGIIADLFGEYDKAANYYQRAISLAPGRTMLQNNFGYSLMMSQDYRRAESVLTTALKSSPANGRIVNNLAMSIAWQGRYDEAIRQLQLVMGEAEANNNVGYVAYLAGDYPQAESLFRKAIRLKPSFYQRAARNLELVLNKRQ